MAGRSEFHISRKARDRYRVRDSFFPPSGKALRATFHGARLFARKMREVRETSGTGGPPLKAGELNAIGLIHAIFRHMIGLYRERENPGLFPKVLERVCRSVREEEIETFLGNFLEAFPPASVYRGEIDAETFLGGETGGIPNRMLLLQEALLLWVANRNPAISPYIELFDETPLGEKTAYPEILADLHAFFDTQPRFGPDDENLVDMLMSPAREVPDSLSGQLEYIRARWGYLLGDFLALLLRSQDLMREETKWGLLGPGEAYVYDFTELEEEPERFTPDRAWMPNLVLIVKNAYVWLDQLSRTTGRRIDRLDGIPDEELDRLARWGFSGLWLIGIWERSPASRRIKQMCGNPEALASAYAVFEYEVASGLGGEEAFKNLKERAMARSIRMATDMVPNHMGIDSPWVLEHPGRFLSLDRSPFPAYRFDTENLSRAEGVGLFLEAHYFDRTDAAVVFKRVDFQTGEERYVYHGNDGTSMPWNDTAQLNYLAPEAREAVIQAIVRVARKSPIIRFDAAMTLTKRHHQRLWYPEPGAGGAIPTRAERGLSKAEFNARMPAEFWREVVERVQAEAPDTLLLAEAFWLMEGYFVRTLGMHRVYNSAFMNMLKDEDNAKYRTVLKNTLEFDPEVLQRFVNFMSNPDEETALAQFGKGDKYFGTCTLMATLPGLPLFAHGQIEGRAEKYGMEYCRAYWDEKTDEGFLRYHEETIFPLLRKRALFAGARNFLLYDFFTPEGKVNEDVFAFSNRAGDERALVLYHNRYGTAKGWVRTSVAFREKGTGDGSLVQRTLAEGLALTPDEGRFWIFRDHVPDLEYIRTAKELAERGLYVELGAYQRQVFLDFREVLDSADRPYRALASDLAGRGVPDMERALKEVRLRPLRDMFRKLVSAGVFRVFIQNQEEGRDQRPDGAFLDSIRGNAEGFLAEVKRIVHGTADVGGISSEIRNRARSLLLLPSLAERLESSESSRLREAGPFLRPSALAEGHLVEILTGWLFTHGLKTLAGPHDAESLSLAWMEEWGLDSILAETLGELGHDSEMAPRSVDLIKNLVRFHGMFPAPDDEENPGLRILEALMQDGTVRRFIRFQDDAAPPSFDPEAFNILNRGLFSCAVLDRTADLPEAEGEKEIEKLHRVFLSLAEAVRDLH